MLTSIEAELNCLEGREEEGRRGFLESLELCRRVGDPKRTSFCLEKLAEIAVEESPGDVLPLAREAVDTASKARLENRTDRARAVLARVLLEPGRPEEARACLDRMSDREIGAELRERLDG